jgi:hypothetical protein
VTKVEAQVNSVFVDNVDNILDPQEGVTELIVNTVDNIVYKKVIAHLAASLSQKLATH